MWLFLTGMSISEKSFSKLCHKVAKNLQLNDGNIFSIIPVESPQNTNMTMKNMSCDRDFNPSVDYSQVDDVLCRWLETWGTLHHRLSLRTLTKLDH